MIRQAQPADFAALFPILNQIFEEMEMETIQAIPEKDFYKLLEHGFNTMDYRYSYTRTLVHETNGTVDGMLTSYSHEDEAIIDAPLEKFYAEYGITPDLAIFTDVETKPGEWYIDSLAVSPSAWGKGIGGALLDAAPDLARKNGYKKISLNVDKTNPHARHLYDKKGFVTDGELPIGKHMYDHMIKEV